MSIYELLDPAIRQTIDVFPEFELTTEILPIVQQAERDALELADALAGLDDRGKPVIIPGHNQGRHHAQRLIKKEINSTELSQQPI
jgi:hypothetical protein